MRSLCSWGVSESLVPPDCDSYLLLLLTAHEHKQPVPHLQPQSVYDQMLGKPVKPPTRERAASIVFLQDPDVWVDESALLPLPKKHAPRDKRARAAPSQDALLDDFPDLDTVLEHPAIEDAGSEGDASDAASAKPEPNLDDNEARGSSTSSSSSDSSSSSSSGSSSSSNTSGSSASRGAAKAKAHAKRNMSASHAFGACRLTPTKTGWQMTCGHPGHRPEQASAACTTTRSNAIAGEDECLRTLKTWALWGQTKPTKAAHQKVWAKVVKAASENRLPCMAELDANPP